MLVTAPHSGTGGGHAASWYSLVTLDKRAGITVWGRAFQIPSGLMLLDELIPHPHEQDLGLVQSKILHKAHMSTPGLAHI